MHVQLFLTEAQLTLFLAGDNHRPQYAIGRANIMDGRANIRHSGASASSTNFALPDYFHCRAILEGKPLRDDNRLVETVAQAEAQVAEQKSQLRLYHKVYHTLDRNYEAPSEGGKMGCCRRSRAEKRRSAGRVSLPIKKSIEYPMDL